MTTTALDRCVHAAGFEFPVLAETAQQQLAFLRSRLRDCERELAAMKAGGVWLKEQGRPPKDKGEFLVNVSGYRCWFISRLDDAQILDWSRYLRIIGPLPSEGRDDGE